MLSSLLCCCCLLQETKVTASTLSGDVVSGELVEMSEAGLKLSTAAGAKAIPLDSLIEIRWPPPESTRSTTGQLYLIDGSRLGFSSIISQGREMKVRSDAFGQCSIPLDQIRAVRLRGGNSSLDAWNALLNRTRSSDLLVLPKKQPGELDHTPGVVGAIGEKKLTFVLGGEEIPVSLKKAFGVIYGRKPKKTTSAFVVDASGDRLHAKSVRWLPEKGHLRCVLMSGDVITYAPGKVLRVDCSGGKIAYLDEMDPVFHKYTSAAEAISPTLRDELYERTFRYCRGHTMDNEPLRLGGREYQRGLWIHSRTELGFRLDGRYSRFQALVGIDDKIPRRFRTKARLVIRADRKTVFDEEIALRDKPRQVRCDISSAEILEIVVDFGEADKDGRPTLDSDRQDWVDLVNARVVK